MKTPALHQRAPATPGSLGHVPRWRPRWITWMSACLLAAFGAPALADHGGLLIFCGTTMVRPITELAKQFGEREKIHVSISQGGSEDLYLIVRKNRTGDVYFPGEPSYYDKFKEEGLLGKPTPVGFNQMAIFVKKGNPSKVKPQLQELLRKDLLVGLGNAESGAAGTESKAILDRYGLYPAVVKRAAVLLPDSRGLALAIRRGEIDITLSWRATASFPDNQPYMDAIDLPATVARPQALLLIPLSFSKQPALAQRFIAYVASPEGQAAFRRHGFMDASGNY